MSNPSQIANLPATLSTPGVNVVVSAPPGPTADQKIIIGGLIILVFGVVEATIQGKPKTPVIQGAIVVMLMASLASALFPNTLGRVASAIVLLTAGAVVVSDLPPIIGSIIPLNETEEHTGGSHITGVLLPPG